MNNNWTPSSWQAFPAVQQPQWPDMHIVLLAGFVVLSSVMILWQINEVVRGGETNYISATLSLYISIYNLFSSLLQLLGIVGGDRD